MLRNLFLTRYKEIFILLLGCFLYALSVVLFIDPAQIIPGSITGVAIIIKAISNAPIGVVSILINIPLMIYAVFKLGKKILIYTIFTILTTSFLIDALSFVRPFTENIMLAAIFGGIVMGIGLGMILKAGGTTGGTTVVGRVITMYFPRLPIGNILLVIDFLIILSGSIVLRNWDLLLYSIINLYVCVIYINLIMYFQDKKFLLVIQSKNMNDIYCEINQNPKYIIKKFSNEEGIVICSKKDLKKLESDVNKMDSTINGVLVELKYIFGDFD